MSRSNKNMSLILRDVMIIWSGVMAFFSFYRLQNWGIFSQYKSFFGLFLSIFIYFLDFIILIGFILLFVALIARRIERGIYITCFLVLLEIDLIFKFLLIFLNFNSQTIKLLVPLGLFASALLLIIYPILMRYIIRNKYFLRENEKSCFGRDKKKNE